MLGRGAMADVYRARDCNAKRDVALKILRQPLTRDHEAMERFKREARVQEMVQHKNVAALYGGGVTDVGEPYLVVELLRGKSLRTVLKTAETSCSSLYSTSWEYWSADARRVRPSLSAASHTSIVLMASRGLAPFADSVALRKPSPSASLSQRSP